ncbi:hypothetical protein [Rathayibacter sp. AY1D3]|uniref:hypothetical protein n=1 Tax=Rathayibacter sp. AY1D3 TaxID=2080544 RepID=UPI000CE7B673|nr:hypothetical protein [Rathayibacter sp. AY1D3]PPH85153.1 hypothetical protein C5C64_16910 [Rathayibacter sp. AY1D3]
MTSPAFAINLDRARFRIGVLAVVHFALAVALVPFTLLHYGNLMHPAFDEAQDLRDFGPAVQWATLGAWVPALVTPVVAFITVRRLAHPRQRYWIVPVIGIAASVTLHFLPYLFFETPQLPTGG